MESFSDILALIQRYFDEGNPTYLKDIKIQFRHYYRNNKTIIRKQKITDYPDDEIAALKNILISVNLLTRLSDPLPAEYSEMTIKKFFQALCRQSEDFLILNVTRLIENQLSRLTWILVGSAAGAGSILTAFLVGFSSCFNYLKNIALRIMESPKAVPVLGFITSNVRGILEIFYRKNDSKKAKAKLRREIFFLIAGMVFNSIAYALWFAGFSILSFVGPFIMLGASMSLMKQIVSLWQMRRKYNDFRLSHPLLDDSSLSVKRSNIRLESGIRLQKKILVTEVVSALLTLGLIGLSTFFPGGFIVVVSCFIAICTIEVIRYGLEIYLKYQSEKQLHQDLLILNNASGMISMSPGAIEPTNQSEAQVSIEPIVGYAMLEEGPLSGASPSSEYSSDDADNDSDDTALLTNSIKSKFVRVSSMTMFSPVNQDLGVANIESENTLFVTETQKNGV